ncbi:hypothetical protein SLEP1_g50680 [Rubroshorea leprosula]|uniref:Uncharacterized protein n=1 Tax=Rubroshorea leprosula TaxID=152421 RepID=A0AAV5M1Q4_9ROSI|nr:hypothetical protein SLEP1_g50680 [Rubroshorea leprosula]
MLPAGRLGSDSPPKSVTLQTQGLNCTLCLSKLLALAIAAVRSPTPFLSVASSNFTRDSSPVDQMSHFIEQMLLRDQPLELEQPREERLERWRREQLRFKLSGLELLRPVPWRREQILLKYDEPFTKQMLLNFRDRSLSELKQAWGSLSEDVIPQNFKLNHPPIWPRLSFTGYPIGNVVRKSVMETIVDDVSEQKSAFDSLSNDENFQKQVAEVLKYYCGREIPHKSSIGNWPCRGLRKEFPILTGSQNIVNAVVQILLAKGLGKKRIVVATRDGQHGLAIVDICARHLHAEVSAVDPGMDSKSAAIWDWVTNIEITHYILGSNAMATGAMSYSVPDDDDEPELYSTHAGTDCVRCRRCGSNMSRQHQEYHNQLHHQSAGAKLVLGAAAFTTKFCTLTRNVEGFTDHFSKSCTWLSSIFDEADGIFAVPGSLGGWVNRTRLPQICEKWKNDTGNLASVSEVVSKVVHVLRGVADEAGRLAIKAKMAIIPARVAAVRAAAARLGAAGTATAPAAIADDS